MHGASRSSGGRGRPRASAVALPKEGDLLMNYTFFAVGCYIFMRGLQVVFEEHLQERWCKIVTKCVTVVMLYAALASLIVWYKEIPFLGFGPGR